MSALKAGNVYVFDAFGDEQKWSADELRFTVDDLEAISEDTVLVASSDLQTGETGETLPTAIPRGQFNAAACATGAS